jgi:hypothetical protein
MSDLLITGIALGMILQFALDRTVLLSAARWLARQHDRE